MFPTKALAHDQLVTVNELIADLGQPIAAQAYDGDASRERRKSTRSAGGILITNPDMLHTWASCPITHSGRRFFRRCATS
ncbi:MAG: hypothetical protein U0559_05090 [Anaerolineae bacterium]